MKALTKLALTTGLLLASSIAWGHAGHEAIGDGLHIEHLLAAGALVIAVSYGLIRSKWNGED